MSSISPGCDSCIITLPKYWYFPAAVAAGRWHPNVYTRLRRSSRRLGEAPGLGCRGIKWQPALQPSACAAWLVPSRHRVAPAPARFSPGVPTATPLAGAIPWPGVDVDLDCVRVGPG